MQYFEKKNDFPNAYKYAVRYANAQDSLRKSISLATALQFETNFEFERKIREMEKLKSENVTKTSELERVATSNVALMSLVFLFVVVVVITTYINVRSYGSLRKIQKQNQKINQQKHALEIYSMQLEKANQDIALQKELLEERNRNILLMNDNLENIVANRTRDLAKKNEQITQYAYVNAHKLRAPVATIKGLVKVFKLVESPAEKELIISKISESSENLDKIIHEIQDIIGEKYDDDNFVIKS
jgi:signal transduction histidine kinase